MLQYTHARTTVQNRRARRGAAAIETKHYTPKSTSATFTEHLSFHGLERRTGNDWPRTRRPDGLAAGFALLLLPVRAALITWSDDAAALRVIRIECARHSFVGQPFLLFVCPL